MNYKYEDLVVIPKKWLKNALYKEYGKSVISVEERAKPLLPIVEDAFNVGVDCNAAEGFRTIETRNKFIKIGVELIKQKKQ